MKLVAGRFLLAKERPYLSSALWRLHPIERRGLGTLGVSKHWHLFYDPAALEKWSVREMASVLYHELNHLLRDHHARAVRCRDDVGKLRLWQLSVDAEVNDDLMVEEGIKLPEGAVTPSALSMSNNLLAEEYYETLLKRASGKSLPKVVGIAAGRCGSCAHGHDAPWEKEAAASAAESEAGPVSEEQSPSEKTTVPAPKPPPAPSPAELGLIKTQVATAIQAAGRGEVPAHLQRWADEMLNPPKVDWRILLARELRAGLIEKGQQDYSYRRPSRRQPPNIILPSFVSYKPRVACIMDTSGSMGQGELSSALAEIGGIIAAAGCQITALCADAEVHSVRQIMRASQIELQGGGGTDMGVAIQAAAKLRPRPNAIVVLTDGLTPWGTRPPMRVIIALIGSGSSAYPPPPWARVVRVED